MICPLCDTEVETIDGKFALHGDCPGGFAYTNQAESKLESRYTDPRPDCPHPGRWHSDDWDSTEHEVSELAAAFVAALRPDLVIETGTAYGQTAYAIGTALAGAGVGRLFTYEVDVHRVEVARKRCEGLPVEVVHHPSLDVDLYKAPFHMDATLGEAQIGFAWFDSLSPLRVPEFRHFYPVLAPGAIVGFHDTAPHHGEVLWSQILEEEAEERLLPVRLRTPRGVVFAEVIK